MPFYIRKSINAGIFRFNLSKSGIGVSTGIRGFRVGSGPSGNYIHMGRNGLYYRSTWSGKGKHYSSANQPYYSPPSLGESSYSQLTEIDSADVLQFQDASSEKLISEINQKYKVPRYWLTVSLLSIIGLLAIIIPIEWLFTALNWDFTKAPIFEIYCLGFPLVIALSVYLYYLNQEQTTVILFYTMDSELENAYQAVHDAFSKLQSCGRSWHLYAQGNIYGMHERKLSSGASTLINRQHIILSNSSPERIKTNIAVPAIPVGRQILFLFPDRILIQEGNRFGAIQYSDIEVKVENSRFIESDFLPNDAKMVGQTWKYPNKDGSPDRRFRDNREIPIVLYNEVHLTSPQGLNEIIQLSKTDVGIEFAEAIKKLGKVTKDIQEKKISQPVAANGDMEKDIMEFYSLLGYTVLRTRKIGDFTLDILLTGKKKEKWITRFENQNEITPEIMRSFQNMVNHEKPLKAGLIVNGVFAPNAKEVVGDMIKDKKVILVDKNQFYEQLSRLRAKREKP
jgi:HJR/Mrr/RecB family endonuclease